MRILLPFVIIWLSSVNALAQVSVKGTEAAQVKEYGSPMTIDLPLAGLFAVPEGKAWVAEDLSGYVCKGVLVKKLVLKWKAKEGGGITVTGDMDLINTGEDDMKTTVRYTLVFDGKALATDSKENIDTEEGGTRYHRFKLASKSAVEGDKKGLVLSIVMAVVKD